ncbi:MAG: hypothetical protein AB7G47_13210 [Mycolicibacterium sp.]|uniref:hypothetical protein n=1 Tax=Mycolicibacterium sp. TaxID=2320850 RepID=UPI003D09A1B2
MSDVQTDSGVDFSQRKSTPDSDVLDAEETGANVAAPSDDSSEVEAQDEQPDPDEQESNPNHEAAKWRHRFRDEQTAHKDTKTALESATTKVEALQRQQVEAMLSAAHVKPAALWAIAELGQLLSEDGTVDVEAVQEAVGKARETLGIQPSGKGTFIANLGNRPDRLPAASNPWRDAFAPKAKR